MGLRLSVVALVYLWLSGCAYGPAIRSSQISGWHGVDVSGVRILGDLEPEAMQRFGRELALFDAAFAHIAGWAPVASSAPVSIYLIRDPELARRFGLGRDVGLGRGLGGWALSTLDGSFAVVEVLPNHVETRLILFHEYTHLLLSRNRRAPLPPWYNEGLATFFSTIRIRDGAVEVGAAPDSGVGSVAGRGPMPLDRLFRGDPGSMRGEETQLFYATSWALSHYLLSSPALRGELSRFVERLAAGEAAPDAQRVAFARSTSALQTELETHVAYLARGVVTEVTLDAGDLSVREPAIPVALAKHDVAYQLGYLTLQLAATMEERSLRPLARRLLGISLAGDPSSARAEAALAEVRAMDGDTGSARDGVQRALQRAPDDERVRLHAARVELERARTTGDQSSDLESALRAAEGHYRHVLSGTPRSVAAWLGLGKTLRRARRDDAALAAFETARRFGWSGELDLGIAEIYLDRGRRDEAFLLLWPLARDPHRGPTSLKAADLIERAGLRPEAPGAAAAGPNDGS